VSFPVREIREIAFGTLVLVDLPNENDFPVPLGLEEAIYAAALPPARRATWVGGRVALHAALETLGAPFAGAILSSDRGAPAMPVGFLGSVSHKPIVAVALVAVAAPGAPVTIGVDLEIARPLRQDIAPRVLTPVERAELFALPPEAREREVLRRFAVKEAIYKALDPWVRRFVSFQEVETSHSGDARWGVLLRFQGGEAFAVEVLDSGDASTMVASARVRRHV
jgi:enterobactin synthetase component D